jgi:hypothetical protein
MNYRDAVLLSSKTLASDNVETIPLKGIDPVSELIVLYKGTNNSTTRTAHPAKLITSIQLVDGSDVLVNLTGIQVVPLEYYHYKKPGLHGINYINDNQCWITARIPFGRWLWDPELALDPLRFSNPQIIISTDLNGGGTAPDAGSLEVIARCFDRKKPALKGFIRSRQTFTYTLVASGDQDIDIPVDQPIMRMMFQAYAVGYATNTQLSKIRLSEDNDKSVPIENQVSDLLKVNISDLQPYTETFRIAQTTTAAAFWVTPCYEENVSMESMLAVIDSHDMIPQYGGQFLADAETGGEYQGLAHGWSPLGTLAIDFGDNWDYEDWYDLQKLGTKSLRARVTGGASLGSGTAQLVLQTLQRY